MKKKTLSRFSSFWANFFCFFFVWMHSEQNNALEQIVYKGVIKTTITRHLTRSGSSSILTAPIVQSASILSLTPIN